MFTSINSKVYDEVGGPFINSKQCILPHDFPPTHFSDFIGNLNLCQDGLLEPYRITADIKGCGDLHRMTACSPATVKVFHVICNELHYKKVTLTCGSNEQGAGLECALLCPSPTVPVRSQ